MIMRIIGKVLMVFERDGGGSVKSREDLKPTDCYFFTRQDQFDRIALEILTQRFRGKQPFALTPALAGPDTLDFTKAEFEAEEDPDQKEAMEEAVKENAERRAAYENAVQICHDTEQCIDDRDARLAAMIIEQRRWYPNESYSIRDIYGTD
jgi:hypothetical protein